MRFAMGNGFVVLGLVLLSGCLAEQGHSEYEESLAVPRMTYQTHFETIFVAPTAVEHESIIAPVVVPEPDNDPCKCTDTDCREEWVVANLGCNVCVSLRCENQEGIHVCTSCPD